MRRRLPCHAPGSSASGRPCSARHPAAVELEQEQLAAAGESGRERGAGRADGEGAEQGEGDQEREKEMRR